MEKLASDCLNHIINKELNKNSEEKLNTIVEDIKKTLKPKSNRPNELDKEMLKKHGKAMMELDRRTRELAFATMHGDVTGFIEAKVEVAKKDLQEVLDYFADKNS